MSAWWSIPAQVERMQELAPYMQERALCDALAVWTGPLRPLQRTYSVTIIYVGPLSLGELELVGAFAPAVRLDRPALRFIHPRTGEDVPHVYWDRTEPAHSKLCLYDPAAGEWSAADFIAETIVPWTCDWLACYEGWLATGKWTGGGRHPRTSPAKPHE